MRYDCCDRTRRTALQAHPTLNGIDFLEVVAGPAGPQTQLDVWLVKDMSAAYVAAGRLVASVEGGDRLRNIAVVSLTHPDLPNLRLLRVRLNQAGDFSTYTLRLTLDLAEPPALPAGPVPALDPILSLISFSFKADCPTEFDCLPAAPTRPTAPTKTLSYVAKDYATFRQLMLDRLALTVPDWAERNPADAGIALVELIAYVSDYLSYQQDAVATEAYLHTARLRTSVRRHARLVDYSMHEGSNARVWVQVQVSADGPLPRASAAGQLTLFLTQPAGRPLPAYLSLTTHTPDYQQALNDGAEVFELMQNPRPNDPAHDTIPLFVAHNELLFYTWGDTNCRLPVGATSATLLGHVPNLAVGQVLVLAEVLDPHTGLAADADPTHRHAVRLTEITPDTDPLFGQNVTRIRWHEADALPIVFWLSATPNANTLNHVSRAFGNIVLADYGRTWASQSPLPDTVPAPTPDRTDVPATGCAPAAPRFIPPRYRPRLDAGPITQAAPYDPAFPPDSAQATLRWSLADVRPVLRLHETNTLAADTWTAHRDLLNSQRTDTHLVAETETDGTTYLRFRRWYGGARPQSGTLFRPRTASAMAPSATSGPTRWPAP